MKRILLLLTLIAFSTPALAGVFDSVEDRSAAVNAELKGNESYYADLARQYADIAEAEKGQHDLRAAHAFIKMAEEAAAKTKAEVKK